MCVLSHFSRIQLFETVRTAAHQAPLSRDSPGKNTGVGCHALLQGIFSDPGIKPVSLEPPALVGGFFPLAPPGKPRNIRTHQLINSCSISDPQLCSRHCAGLRVTKLNKMSSLPPRTSVSKGKTYVCIAI